MKILDSDTVVITLTINFPGDYVNMVYGEINDDIVQELFAEYLTNVNVDDLIPEWRVHAS